MACREIGPVPFCGADASALRPLRIHEQLAAVPTSSANEQTVEKLEWRRALVGSFVLRTAWLQRCRGALFARSNSSPLAVAVRIPLHVL
ncbi:unnamed protein product, partial [Iphiclides podalirius]